MVLDVNQISKLVGRHKEAIVDNVSFSLEEGEVMGMLGPNGAGKTTTMKMLLGLVSISSGSATIMGKPVPLPESRIGVGFLPEAIPHPDYLTVEEYLQFHAKLNGIKNIKQAVDENLKLVGLEDRKTRQLSLCSKGMRQRADIARVMLNNAKLIFLDEPVSGLDPLGQVMLKDIIVSLKRRGISLLINSHAVGVLEDVCDKVCIMNRGRILADGNMHNMLKTSKISVKAKFEDFKAASDFTKNLKFGEIELAENGSVTVEIESKENSGNSFIKTVMEAGGQISEVTPVVLTLDKLFVNVLSKANVEIIK